MSNQLSATQRKIVTLAKIERGSATRQDFFGDESHISFDTYSNLETGSHWPRQGKLRVIEELLSWKPGVIDEALTSCLAAGDLTLDHMRGKRSFGARMSIQDFTNQEFFADLTRRVKEIEDLVYKLDTYTLDASDDLGGSAPDQIEES